MEKYLVLAIVMAPVWGTVLFAVLVLLKRKD
jgi:hypothetical protein